MIANLKPYSAYKPSGVEWLREVPKHWETRRVKSLSIVKRGASPRPIGDARYFDDDGEYAWVRIADVTASNHYLEKTTQRLSRLGQSLSVRLQPRALFLSIAGSVGKPIITNIQCCIHDGFVYFPQFRGNVEFLYRLFSCGAPFARLGKLGTQLNLNTDTVGGIYLAWPPESEQTAIVRFLDHADRRIRRYIRAKQKLIALLEEQKQAIIHQAVTGQIDVRTGQPYPAYKPSSVPWLRKVPAHWELRPAKWYFREVDDRSETGSEELLSVSHITGVTTRSEKNVTMFKAESNIGHKLCRFGDLVINTMWAWMAALGVARQFGIVSPSYAVYRPHPSSRLLGEYADLLLHTTTYKNEYICRSTGIRSSRLRLYPEEFLRIKLLCPPLEEQQAIAEFVSKESTNARRTIDLTHDELSLLNEYRTRLIADTVTGKLDVREAAAAPPEVDPLVADDTLNDTLNVINPFTAQADTQ